MAVQKRIFISRALKPNSPFKSLLGNKAIIEGQSLLVFTPVALKKTPLCDWLFFYSKKGIEFGWTQLQTLKPLPKIAVLGAASEQYFLQQNGRKADFVGTGVPATTAANFLKLAQGQTVGFVQARHSRQSVAQLLGKQIHAQKLVVYNNIPKPAIGITPCDLLVFTSPLNATAYYQHYPIQNHQTVIAIGQTTAQTLERLGVHSTIVAAAPNEQALAACCLSFL